MPRYFTVAEANALLPVLRPHVERLMRAWRRLSVVHEQVVALLERKPRDDLGGPPLSLAAAELVRLQNAMVAIQGHGVELKDPVTGLLDFPALVANAAEALEPHRVATYLHDTAGRIHAWYHKAHVLNEPEPITRARLLLARAAQIVLRNGLTMLGISAPERM